MAARRRALLRRPRPAPSHDPHPLPGRPLYPRQSISMRAARDGKEKRQDLRAYQEIAKDLLLERAVERGSAYSERSRTPSERGP